MSYEVRTWRTSAAESHWARVIHPGLRAKFHANLPATYRSVPLAESNSQLTQRAGSDAGRSIHCADTPAVHFATNAWQRPSMRALRC